MRIVETARWGVRFGVLLMLGACPGGSRTAWDTSGIERGDADAGADADAAWDASWEDAAAPDGPDAAVSARDAGSNHPGTPVDCGDRLAPSREKQAAERHGDWVRTAVLVPDEDDACQSGTFGDARALTRDLIVVGRRGAAPNPGAGAAYVFARRAEGWVREAKLVGAARGFGWAVAVADQTIVVGDPNEPCSDANSAARGAAHIMVRDAEGWVGRARLTPPDNGCAAPRFGESVAVHGTTVAVGAPTTNVEFPARSGAVYVFVNDDADWRLQAGLVASLPESGVVGDESPAPIAATQLGAVVALADDRLVSGTHQAAYAFTRDGARWSQDPLMVIDDRDHWAVAVSGDAVLLGAPCPRPDAWGAAAQCEGAAHVWRWNGEAWQQEAKLTASVPSAVPNDSFGCRVALADDVALVERCDDQVELHSFVFQRDAEGWQEQARFARGGAALAATADTLVLSGPTTATEAREAWVFERRR
jgi:hypothetical protein